jgi:hypothetical protein
VEIGFPQLVDGVGEEQVSLGKLFGSHFARSVMAFLQFTDSLRVHVKADGSVFLAKGYCHGETYVA